MKPNRFIYSFVRYFFRVLLLLYNRCSVRWSSPLCSDEYVIVACNHTSNLDPVIVGAFFPRRLRYFAKEELFVSRFLGTMIRILGAVPVSRADNASAASALKGFIKLYQDGSDVLIFPEGGRSEDGLLKPLEGGVALIAQRAEAPILPVFIRGAFDAMPPGAKWVSPHKVRVIFGDVLRFSQETYKGKEGREVIMQALTASLQKLEEESKREQK